MRRARETEQEALMTGIYAAITISTIVPLNDVLCLPHIHPVGVFLKPLFHGSPLFQIFRCFSPKWSYGQTSLGNDKYHSHTWHITMHLDVQGSEKVCCEGTSLTLFIQPFPDYFGHRATDSLMATLVLPRNQSGPGCFIFSFVSLTLSLWGQRGRC